MFEQDWMMRQIEGLTNLLARIIFNKETTNYEIIEEDSNSDTDLLFWQLVGLIDDGKINEAENLLYEKIDTDNKRYLELAIDFYAKLNDLSNSSLEQSGFTREEIDEGLKDVAKIYGITTSLYKGLES